MEKRSFPTNFFTVFSYFDRPSKKPTVCNVSDGQYLITMNSAKKKTP